MIYILLMLQVMGKSIFINEAIVIGPDSDSSLVYLDLTYLDQLDLNDPQAARKAWDTLHLTASVQGIVNRDSPRLFIRLMAGPDDFWWDYLRNEHGWLAGRDIVRIDSVQAMLTHFASELKGVVVYRERPWVGSNLASTIAGVEDRVALRYDASSGSVFRQVLGSGVAFVEDRLDLFDAEGVPVWRVEQGADNAPSGSDKRDAYLWLKRRCLDTGQVSKQYMGYYIDAFWLTDPTKSSLPNCTLTNHDFFISQRAMFMDLHVWEDESPVDEPDQPAGTDLKTLRELMRAMHDYSDGGIIHIGGFTPWAWKYTDHLGAGSAHGGVDTEWKLVKEVSSYNGLIDADALGYSGMTNASFYQHFPLEARYPQNPRPKLADIQRAGHIGANGRVAKKSYVLLYMGDYDSAAWLNQLVPDLWKDPARGTIPCTWAFNPNLDRRAPHAMHYVRTHQSPNDWFITGDNGAGYLNPSMLTAPRPEPDLPDGWERWIRHNIPAYERYDLTITGFLIEGHSPTIGELGMDAYMRFSPDGLVCHRHCGKRGLYRGEMPYVKHTRDIAGTPEEAAATIRGELDDRGTQFLFFRSVIQTPGWHAELIERMMNSETGGRVRFVDPYTFFGLLKLHEKQHDVVRPGKPKIKGAILPQGAEM